MTALDIIQYNSRIEGIIRAAEIISELNDELDEKYFEKKLFSIVNISTLQKLGYMLEEVIKNKNLANKIFSYFKKNNIHLNYIPMESGKAIKGCQYNKHWKIIINRKIRSEK